MNQAIKRPWNRIITHSIISSELWLLVSVLPLTPVSHLLYLLGLVYALLLALVASLTDGTMGELSIAHSVFLPREFDPFCDTYLETVTRLRTDELMHLPKLNDGEFIDQLVRGVDTIPGKKNFIHQTN